MMHSMLRTKCSNKMINAAYCTVVSNLVFFFFNKRNFSLSQGPHIALARLGTEIVLVCIRARESFYFDGRHSTVTE